MIRWGVSSPHESLTRPVPASPSLLLAQSPVPYQPRPLAWRARGQRGASTAEQALLLSVILVALLGVAPLLVQALKAGVLGLSQDVVELLTGRRSPPDAPAGDSPEDGSSGSGGGGSHDLPQLPGGTSGSSGGTGGSDDTDSGDTNSGDTGGASDPGSSEEAPPEEEESTCPYVYDETSERWRDPETGQYVSSAAASQAGC